MAREVFVVRFFSPLELCKAEKKRYGYSSLVLEKNVILYPFQQKRVSFFFSQVIFYVI